jgi:hypothetical protein
MVPLVCARLLQLLACFGLWPMQMTRCPNKLALVPNFAYLVALAARQYLAACGLAGNQKPFTRQNKTSKCKKKAKGKTRRLRCRMWEL